jgi:predicted Rossmann fold nucleotide-binding protein DprA/Smf involved in DNA uptake
VQVRIWEALGSARHVDELIRELGLPAGDLSRHLTMMEMKKAVTRLPGSRYERR